MNTVAIAWRRRSWARFAPVLELAEPLPGVVHGFCFDQVDFLGQLGLAPEP